MLEIIKLGGFSAQLLQFEITIFKPKHKRTFIETGDDITAQTSLKKVSLRAYSCSINL
jgi:hypothetical protein